MPARILHIHAGLPKTGTSAVQRVIAANRQALASQGYTVPETGYETGQHHALFFALCGPSPVRRRRIVDALLSELSTVEGEAVISSEFASLVLRHAWGSQGFAALRSAGFRLKFYLTLRHQGAFAVSAYPEFLRNLLVPVSFDHFLHHQALPLVQDYEALISEFARWGEVVVMPYRRGRAQRSFMNALGVTVEGNALEDEKHVNPSLGAVGVGALQDALGEVAPHINRWNARMHLRRHALRITRAWMEPDTPFNPLSADLVSTIGALVSEPNDRVARKYWGCSWAEALGDDTAPMKPARRDQELRDMLRVELVEALEAQLAIIGKRPRTWKALLGRPVDVAADRLIRKRVSQT